MRLGRGRLRYQRLLDQKWKHSPGGQAMQIVYVRCDTFGWRTPKMFEASRVQCQGSQATRPFMATSLHMLETGWQHILVKRSTGQCQLAHTDNTRG